MGWLLDTTSFITRSHCGPGWTINLILASRLVNFLIFLAYFSIPLTLVCVWVEISRRSHASRVIRGVQEVLRESRWVIGMFSTFIFACGLTHLCDVLVFDWAPYRLFTLVDTLTAIASIPTAILLPAIFTKVLNVLSREEEL
jgi:hypothetical protein